MRKNIQINFLLEHRRLLQFQLDIEVQPKEDLKQVMVNKQGDKIH